MLSSPQVTFLIPQFTYFYIAYLYLWQFLFFHHNRDMYDLPHQHYSIRVFWTWLLTSSSEVYIFICIHDSNDCLSVSTWITSLSISCKESLVVMSSLSFYLTAKDFISTSFLKYRFAWYNILGWKVFFFFFLSVLWIYNSILSWPARLLLRNLRIVPWIFPYMLLDIFLMLFLKLSRCFWLLIFDYNMPQRGHLCFKSIRESLSFPDPDVRISHKT